MSLALQRFTTCHSDLLNRLKSISRQREKAHGFFDSGAREVIFRLESLCRLYRNIQDKKFFDSWYKEFKALEDTLGSIDNLLAMHEEFSQYHLLKKQVEKTLASRLSEELGFLDDVLKNNHWL